MHDARRILVTCDLGEQALAVFAQQPGFSVRVENIKDEETLRKTIPGFHAVVVRSNVQVTETVLVSGSELQVVGRAGIGVDNIDLEAATRLGVAVVNAPGGNVVTTAEHAIALLTSLARKIPAASASMKEQRWEKKKFLGRELRDKVLGIVGVGRVGSIVADLALGLRMRVVAFDPYLSEERASKIGVEKVPLEELLRTADFLTIHTPLTPETRGLIGRDCLAKVKPGLLLINCARGGIVDHDALLEAIEAGRVGGAALDVFEVEPPPPHPLYARDEVILTPHLGASTVEAQAGVAVEVAENITAFLNTGVAANALNVPSVPREVLRRLGPFLELAERLGRMAAQVAEGPVESVRVLCQGGAADGIDLVTASFLKGLLSPVLSTRVNAVNAPAVARERGIRVISSTTADAQDFTELLSIQVQGSWGEHEFEGTLFGKSEPRLVRLDDFRIDALPRGTLILIYNDDVPGVIGAVGACLGRHEINIAGMYNGRMAAGGRAISLVNIDGVAPEDSLEDLRGLPHILSVRQILL